MELLSQLYLKLCEIRLGELSDGLCARGQDGHYHGKVVAVGCLCEGDVLVHRPSSLLRLGHRPRQLQSSVAVQTIWIQKEKNDGNTAEERNDV